MIKHSTKELAAQWKYDRRAAAKKLRLILEGKAKCDDQGRAALANLIEYFDATKVKTDITNNLFDVRPDLTHRCENCGYFFCNCLG
jgi:hypothetical protein